MPEDVETLQITPFDSWRPESASRPIELSGDFIIECLRNFGIKEDQALETVNLPDKTDQLDFYGFTIRLHFKELPTQPPSGLLVVESDHDGKRTLDFGFRIYPQLAKGVQDLRPLEILRVITNSFGFLIRVGQQTGKLVIGERFDFNGSLVEGLEQPRGSMIQQFYFKVDKGLLPKATCPLAYSIDTDLYSSWLKSQARRVN